MDIFRTEINKYRSVTWRCSGACPVPLYKLPAFDILAVGKDHDEAANKLQTSIYTISGYVDKTVAYQAGSILVKAPI